MIKILYFLMLMATASAKNLLYVEGKGGDYAGAALIIKKAKNAQIISDLKLSTEDDNLYLIGQGACNTFIKNKKDVDYNKLFMYSHILDSNIVNFLNDTGKKITLFITPNQFFKLSNDSISTRVANKILRTVDYDDPALAKKFEQNKSELAIILSKELFLIGGDYKNSNFKDIKIPINSYATLIEKQTKTRDVNIILHPRFFSNLKTEKEKANKIYELLKILESNKIKATFYTNAIKGKYELILKNPDFGLIMYAIEKTDLASKPIFATADQCNISADDFSNKIRYNLLTEDESHLSIIADSTIGNISVTDLIIKSLSE